MGLWRTKEERILVKLFRNKNFNYFISSLMISAIGDIVDDVAFMQLVYILTNSTVLSGYIFIVKIIITFLGIFMSSIADKWNKKKIIFFSSFSQAMVLAIIYFIYVNNKLNFVVIIIAMILQTIFCTISAPAKNALISEILCDNEIVEARSFINISHKFIELFSYLISGTVIGIIGIGGALLCDIVTFIISGVLICKIFIPNKIKHNGNKLNFIEDTYDGLKIVFKSKIIFIIMSITFVANMLVTPTESFINIYLQNNHAGNIGYSLYMFSISVGGIIGGFAILYLKKYFKINILMMIGFICGGMGLILLSFEETTKIIYCFAALINGISFSLVSVINSSVLQLNAPKEMIGRVFSLFKCISFVAGPLGIWIVGQFGEIYSLNNIFGIIGILLLILALAVSRFSIIKKKL